VVTAQLKIQNKYQHTQQSLNTTSELFSSLTELNLLKNKKKKNQTEAKRDEEEKREKRIKKNKRERISLLTSGYPRYALQSGLDIFASLFLSNSCFFFLIF